MAFLDLDGLSHLVQWFKGQLGGKVDKVSGKQLSTNDYTTAEKNKLAGLSNYSHPTTSGNKHIPAGGAAGKILGWASDGTAQWVDDKNTTYGVFKGATTSADGGNGLVPAPKMANAGQYLKGDGTWGTPTNTTYSDATQSAHGLMTAADKTKLDGIAAGANRYIHPSYTAAAAGLYKVTVDASGHVSATTAVEKSDITALGIPSTNTTYSAATQSANGLMSAADKKKLDGIANGANNFTYSLPTASATVLGGVKTGSNITNTSGVLSLTKANVTSALGYTPPTTNTTYGNATTSSSGLMSYSDKRKLDGIASGANKTVVDNALSQSSANPVANSAVTKRLQFLYSFKISRDKWNESSDKSNWNVIVPWSDSSGTSLTGSTTGTPNLTTGMSLGPAMMERTSSLNDNIILSGELSMINQGQIYVCDTNKLSFTVKRRPVCDLMLYFYARQWTT